MNDLKATSVALPISVDELIARARELADKQMPWHFHVAKPGCLLADHDDLSLLLEDIASEALYSATGEGANLANAEQLALLLHGDDILDASNDAMDDGGMGPEHFKGVTETAARLQSTGASWHHHVLFPDCMFNPTPTTWTLFIESEQRIAAQASAPREPRAALNCVEKLFYNV